MQSSSSSCLFPTCEWLEKVINDSQQEKGGWGVVREGSANSVGSRMCPTSHPLEPPVQPQNGSQSLAHTWTPTWRGGAETPKQIKAVAQAHMVMAYCFGFYRSWKHAGFQIANNNYCLYVLWSVPGALPVPYHCHGWALEQCLHWSFHPSPGTCSPALHPSYALPTAISPQLKEKDWSTLFSSGVAESCNSKLEFLRSKSLWYLPFCSSSQPPFPPSFLEKPFPVCLALVQVILLCDFLGEFFLLPRF